MIEVEFFHMIKHQDDILHRQVLFISVLKSEDPNERKVKEFEFKKSLKLSTEE